MSDDGLLGYTSPGRMGKCSLMYHFAFRYRSFHVSFTGWLVDINCVNWPHLLPELLPVKLVGPIGDFIVAQSGGEVDKWQGKFLTELGLHRSKEPCVCVRCDIIAVSMT